MSLYNMAVTADATGCPYHFSLFSNLYTKIYRCGSQSYTPTLEKVLVSKIPFEWNKIH